MPSNSLVVMYKSFFKRLLDFCISLTALLCLSPVILLVTIWLHFANRGAGAFFFQERPGKDTKIFKIIKFKSMNDARDANGKLLPDKERLTKAGKFVRTTSIDELPQLINVLKGDMALIGVLKGDMALIGPRPLLERYLPYYTEREQLRHSVRPGITGLAQVNGRNALDWDSKLELDAQYAEKLSFILDLKIFFKTIEKVVRHEGVIADKKENYLDIERQNKR